MKDALKKMGKFKSGLLFGLGFMAAYYVAALCEKMVIAFISYILMGFMAG
jgi:hypothetical protein